MTIDLDHLRADVQMAQQTGRKMVSMHIDEAMSLLSRADNLAKVQAMVPFRIGWICPEDVHELMRGKLGRVGLSLRKGPRYRVEALVYSLPDCREDSVDEESKCLQDAT